MTDDQRQELIDALLDDARLGGELTTQEKRLLIKRVLRLMDDATGRAQRRLRDHVQRRVLDDLRADLQKRLADAPTGTIH